MVADSYGCHRNTLELGAKLWKLGAELGAELVATVKGRLRIHSVTPGCNGN